MASDTPTTPVLLLNAAEASRALAISPRKLWSLTVGGEIPHVRIGRCLRYAPGDLQLWIAEKKEGARHET